MTTGPEAGGVANHSTGVVVADLFRSAQRSVLVASYAIYQGKKIFRSLAERMNQNFYFMVRMFLDVPRSHGDLLPSPTRLRDSFTHLGRHNGQ